MNERKKEGFVLTSSAIIFNIQRYTIHDGPGIRTELFLKGCPLTCEWCGNPESLKMNIQLGVYKTKCITKKKCNACFEVCPVEGALVFYRNRLVGIDQTKCTNCLACYDACPSDAIKQWGKKMSVEECMVEIRKDIGYYEKSGGGITVSGGEPLLQSDFVRDLFMAAKNENIHTCVETCAHIKWSEIEKVLPYTDLVITDIKHMDSEMHKSKTGVANDLILENIKKIAEQDKEIILRIPIIPLVNDNLINAKNTADFIIDKLNGKVRTLQLLSFMRLGEEKYASLDMEYKMSDVKVKRKAFQKNIEVIAEYFNSRGINCMVGTKEKL